MLSGGLKFGMETEHLPGGTNGDSLAETDDVAGNLSAAFAEREDEKSDPL